MLLSLPPRSLYVWFRGAEFSEVPITTHQEAPSGVGYDLMTAPPPYSEVDPVEPSQTEVALLTEAVASSSGAQGRSYIPQQEIICETISEQREGATVGVDKSDTGAEECLVVVTASKFHREHCRYAKANSRKVPRTMALDVLQCQACKICKP